MDIVDNSNCGSADSRNNGICESRKSRGLHQDEGRWHDDDPDVDVNKRHSITEGEHPDQGRARNPERRQKAHVAGRFGPGT